MFYEISGEVFKEAAKVADGAWIVSYENPCSPRFVSMEELKTLTKTAPPVEYERDTHKGRKQTAGELKRMQLIEELCKDELFIIDSKKRNARIREIADREGTTVKRIQKLFFRHLAGRPLMEERKPIVKEPTDTQKDFTWAVDTFYYSAKKMSLRSAYDMLLLSRYTDADGHLVSEYPTWHSFRHYFYDRNGHRKSRAEISRNGLTNYQRNKRPLFSSAMGWKDTVGTFQMDATMADIYLVSRLDKSAVIGRPNVYLAVDTVTQLIAGIYVGLDSGEQAVISCLANAAMDKVEFCQRYGIEIAKDEWPNEGLPAEIITDKGKEFTGGGMGGLAMKYGIQFESLPPFRPDGKGLVEKSFDLLQQRYKPLLRGKGIIEADAQERWAVDYRSQAVLTLEEFTKVIIHCVLYLNSCRILEGPAVNKAQTAPVASELWKWYEEQGQSSIIPVSPEQVYLLGLERTKATLGRKGISRQGLWYINRDYQKLLERFPMGTTVQIACDKEDMGRIYLIDGLDFIPFELAKFCRQYVGSTQTEYQIEKDRHRASRKELERMDTEGRIRVAQGIKQVLEQAEKQDKGKITQETIQMNRRRELI